MGILVVQRQLYFSRATLGELLIDGKHVAWTLEDQLREVIGEDGKYHWEPELKVPKETAIPTGTYQVVLNYSARFRRVLPMLVNVPDFVAIRFHGANGPQDVEGCIGLGMNRDPSNMSISNAAPAVEAVVNYLRNEESNKVKSYVEVKNG